MELYLQMGHGMKELSRKMILDWGKGNVILSPVNMKQDKLVVFSKAIQSVGGDVLFDPQMFFPKEGNEKLKEYDYWPKAGVTLPSDMDMSIINRELLRINILIGSKAIITPSVETEETKLNRTICIMNDSVNYFHSKTDKEVYATLCLCSETIRNSQTIEDLVDALRNVPAEGYYIVPHPANNEYIIADPLWMIGMMKLLTCLKLAKKKVIVGYSSHQGLIYALAHVDGIASGSWMNTRSFMPGKFKPKDDDIKHKSTWYYLPSAMSEYKATFLDIAMQRGFLSIFEPQGNFSNRYSEMLFKGELPSTTSYNETNSFMHYLYCLNNQCKMLTQDSYENAYTSYELMLNCAEARIKDLKKYGMVGQNRDFSPAIECLRIAMCANDLDYGLKLRLEWHNL